MIYGYDSDSYAHLLLDYCGNLPTFAKEIEHVINNDIVKVGGIIAVTTRKANRFGKGDSFEYIRALGNTKNNNIYDKRCNTERENESYFYSIIGKNYRILEFFYYQDESAMMLTIIKRIK